MIYLAAKSVPKYTLKVLLGMMQVITVHLKQHLQIEDWKIMEQVHAHLQGIRKHWKCKV